MKKDLLIKILSCILSAFIITSNTSISWVSASNVINDEEFNELGLLPEPDPGSDEYKEYLSQYTESSNYTEMPSSAALCSLGQVSEVSLRLSAVTEYS